MQAVLIQVVTGGKPVAMKIGKDVFAINDLPEKDCSFYRKFDRFLIGAAVSSELLTEDEVLRQYSIMNRALLGIIVSEFNETSVRQFHVPNPNGVAEPKFRNTGEEVEEASETSKHVVGLAVEPPSCIAGTVDGERINVKLTPAEYSFMSRLIARQGKIVSKEEAESLMGVTRTCSPKLLPMKIVMLRKKLLRRFGNKIIAKGIRNKGYMLS